VKQFFRIVFYFGVATLFLVVAIVGFTQTRYFRAYLRTIILENYPEYINAKLAFERIEGNLITGAQLHSISLEKDSVEVFSAERIEIKYDPTGFFTGKVPLARLVAVNPKIRLWRTAQGNWNIDAIVIPRPKDTTKLGATIHLKAVELVNASLSFVDSLALRERKGRAEADPPSGAFDYARIELTDVNLVGNARIEPSSVSGSIEKLSFVARNPSFTLTRMAAHFSLNPSLAAVKDLIIQTKHSFLKGDAQLRNIDVAGIRSLAEFERAPVQLNLDIQKLDTKELKQFLYPYVDFLDHSVSLQLKASGTFGRLSVDRLTVRTPKSLLQAQGTISNLHHPEDLELEIACIDNKVHPADLAELLPGLNLPDVRFLGELSYNLVFSGPPTDFTVHINGEADAGAFQAEAQIKIQESLRYKAVLTTLGVDLGLLLQDDTYRGKIFARATVDGWGTNLRTMKTVARIEVDSSSVSELPLNHSVVVFDVSDAHVRSHITTTLGSATYDVSGELRFHRDSTEYQLNGKVRALDLAEILKNPSYESNLSMGMNASGVWHDAARLRSHFVLNIFQSFFNKLPMDSTTILVDYDTRDSSLQTLRVTSAVGEISAEGKFNVGSLLDNVRGGAGLITQALEYRIRNLDSLRAFTPLLVPRTGKFHAGVSSDSKFTDVRIELTIRDLYPIGVFLHEKVRGDVAVRMNLRGEINDMTMAGEAVSKDFSYLAPSVAFAGQNLHMTWDLDGISKDSILSTLGADVQISSQFLKLNTISFSGSLFRLRSKGHEGVYSLSTLVDSTAKVNVEGNYAYRGSLYRLDISQMKVAFGSSEYENAEPVNIVVGIDGLQFKSFSMRHEAEELTVDGFFNPTGVSDLDVNVRGFLLNNVRAMVRASKQPPLLKGLGGIVSARLLLRGSFEYPNVSVDLVADGVRFGETVMGQIEARLSYFEHLLTVFGSYRYNPRDASSPPDMLLSGSLPYELSLTSSHAHEPSGQIDLTMQSRGVRLDLFSPFLPFLSNLSGFLSCDMKMKGSLDAPEYDGYLSLSSARFNFVPLNVQYILDGRFVSNRSSIVLENVTLRNTEQDQSFGKGLLNISGNFTLHGLELGEFDLLANGQLLLMKEMSRPSTSKFYGDLFAATGPSGIRWRGLLANSSVTGEILVKNGRITLPPERETVLLPSRNISIIFADDTTKTKPISDRGDGKKSVALLAANIPGKLMNESLVEPSAFDVPQAAQEEPEKPGSFLDNIVYDLMIEAQGPTQLRLIVNPITNEELFADLRGRLAFEKKGPQARLTGEVEVGSRSYYNYFKKFEATGKLLFTGNPLNPELNIVGKYEGIHRKAPATTVASDTARDLEEKVLVRLEISGTRSEPKLRFSMEEERNGKYEKREGGDVESDAIAFLLSGQYRDELTRAQRSALIGENLIGITSGVLSAPLREYLRKETGVSLDVLYYGGASFEQSTDIRLSGEIGEAVVRFGGRVLNNINNTNVSVELPMSSLLGTESLRNLILTLERRVEGLETVENAPSSRGARLLYRINF
jgi:hypothetical protein